ncbi:MAG: hypothetical protein WDO17_13785 [Alphaproteobacteria bacterium]
MARDQSDVGYEWVNAWAATAMAETSAAMKGQALPQEPHPVPAPAIAIAPIAKPGWEGQLARDIAEIERARDALDALPLVASFSARRRVQALTLVPSRTSDMVPVVIGGVLALVMLTVFGAAAAMTKLAR